MPTKHDPNKPNLRQQQREARRTQIIEVALRLFATRGYDGTSTKEIAREAGITEGLIFHYFPGKADLLAAVMETGHSVFGALKALLAGAEQRPATAVLPEVATGWLQTVRRESEITSVLFSTAQTNPEVAAQLQQLIGEGTLRLSQYLAARVQAGELRPDLPLLSSAQMIFSSLIMFWVAFRKLPDEQWETRAAAHVRDMLSLWFQGANVAE